MALPATQIRSFYAEDAEQSVLGAILRSERALTEVSFLTEDDFWAPANRQIFAAVKLLAAQKRPVDIVTVDEQLGKMSALEAAGGTARLIELVANTPTAANCRAYAELVREAATKRAIRDIGETMIREAADPTTEVSTLIDATRAKLRNLASPGKNPWVSLDDVLIQTYEGLERRTKGEVKAIPTGISSLDRASGGIFKGELTIIGARPNVGKSAFGLQAAMEAARNGVNVCFISLEMVLDQFGQRVFSNAANVDGMKLRKAEINPEDWAALAHAMLTCSGLPMSFYSDSSYIEDIRMEIQRKIDLDGCGLVVLDYLQLLGTRRKTSGDTERVGACSRALKAMTRELNIPIIALAQVNRQAANGGKSRCPVLSELRSAGDIEQDADTVIFLHVPDDENDATVDPRDREFFPALKNAGLQYMVFNIAKQRQGVKGNVMTIFDPRFMRYAAIDRTREG